MGPELSDAGELEAQRVGKADPLAGPGAPAARGLPAPAPGWGRASPAPPPPPRAPKEVAASPGPAPRSALRLRLGTLRPGVLGQAWPGCAVIRALIQAGDVAQVPGDVAGGQR